MYTAVPRSHLDGADNEWGANEQRYQIHVAVPLIICRSGKALTRDRQRSIALVSA